jgi:hypothetical protein
VKKTWKPIVAGIVEIFFGLPSIIGLVWWLVTKYIEHAYDGLDLGIGLLPIIGPFSLAAIFSGWLCFSRRLWWLALISSILGIPAGIVSFLLLASLPVPLPFQLTVPVPVYSFLGFVILVTPTILIILSKKEFKKRVVIMEVPHEA